MPRKKSPKLARRNGLPDQDEPPESEKGDTTDVDTTDVDTTDVDTTDVDTTDVDTTDVDTTDVDTTDVDTTDFAVVGIGASAGGLAAFEAFFSKMPEAAQCGMAFVVVQHLAPDHKSVLTELIRRFTWMKVYEVTDGVVLRPNCTYIIPPN
ncbi:MAG: chemotaxis response regulator CheB, partial [Myxococcota bacterium]